MGMREILFRGKRKDNGEWVEGELRMNYEEALYWCEQFTDNVVLADPAQEKMVLALQAMQKCKEALKKQIPKKPHPQRTPPPVRKCTCPRCFAVEDESANYCRSCGQALDWRDM